MDTGSYCEHCGTLPPGAWDMQEYEGGPSWCPDCANAMGLIDREEYVLIVSSETERGIYDGWY